MVKTILHRDDYNYWIELIGNATFTHTLTVDESSLHAVDLTDLRKNVVESNENQAYQTFVDSLSF